MKKKLLPRAIFSAALITFLFTADLCGQTSGGPDTFGYNWANHLDPLGSAPVYNWINIADTANQVDGLSDDNSAGPFNLGFYFNYYGQWYNTLWIGSNGWISFQNASNVNAPFPSLPTPSAPDNLIAGLMCDLTFKDAAGAVVPGAKAYLKIFSDDSVIVQYDSVPYWDSSATGFSGRNTFQIILNATDHSIRYQYKKLINSTPAYNLVNSGLKIGIEDSTGGDGLQVLDTFPSDSSAIKFYYPGLFSTNDLDDKTISLFPNFPNPANDHTTLRFALQKNSDVRINVSDLSGKDLLSTNLVRVSAGENTFKLNTSKLSAGIYFYSIHTNGSAATGKMLITR